MNDKYNNNKYNNNNNNSNNNKIIPRKCEIKDFSYQNDTSAHFYCGTQRLLLS